MSESKDWAIEYIKLKAERDSLRAEVERLKSLNAGLMSGAICHICYDTLDEDSKNMALTKEREIVGVLREALRWLAHDSKKYAGTDAWTVARRALKREAELRGEK